MTLVLVSSEGGRATCIADTRVSNTPTSSALLDGAAKILAFTARVQFSKHQPKREHIAWEFDVGFAFAGSTLFANTVFAVGSAICRSLYTSTVKTKPALDLVVTRLSETYEVVGRDLNSRRIDGGSTCEIAVFGHCLATRKVRVFHIFGTIEENQYVVKTEEVEAGRILILGNRRAFKVGLERERVKAHIRGYMVLSDIMEDLIEDAAFPDIGGNLQSCIVSSKRIDLSPIFDLRDKQMKIFGMSVDHHFSYSAKYTVGDASPGATLSGYWKGDPSVQSN